MHTSSNFKAQPFLSCRSHLVSSMRSFTFTLDAAVTPRSELLLPLLCEPCIWHKSDMAFMAHVLP